MLGSRIHSTGPAIFSFNDFKSYGEVLSVLSRYQHHYRTRNLKEYRTGNRRVRQWVAMASKELGLLPTTEGALAMKLDLSQIMDGFAGNEHALVAYPLSKDDRKSTRLNSSHGYISYAVFCLKKKIIPELVAKLPPQFLTHGLL